MCGVRADRGAGSYPAVRARRLRARTAGVLLVMGVAASLGSCVHAPKWTVQRAVTPEMVAHMLDQPSAIDSDLKPEEVPAIPVRTHLRPCCAFGTNLQASLGPVPIPLFSMGNIIGLDQVGPHKYDSGVLVIAGSSKKNAFTKENNALIYTCRGGFIDTAHVRDYADWTLFWTAAIARASESGATVELPSEGGRRRVHIRPLPPDLVARYGLRRCAINLGQWIAFELSIWHEIATAYGWASIELYPEYVSAFSPEDLYSNLLGAKIAGGLILERGAMFTDSLYDLNMDRWLHETLAYLRPVDADAGKAAALLVDGIWWSSKARLPDPGVVLRRNFDIGDEIAPWTISRAYSLPAMQGWVDRECHGGERPLVLRRQQSLDGTKFSDLLTLEIDVVVPDHFPFPRPGSTRITQEDFPGIVEAARQANARTFGPEADRPERSPN